MCGVCKYTHIRPSHSRCPGSKFTFSPIKGTPFPPGRATRPVCAQTSWASWGNVPFLLAPEEAGKAGLHSSSFGTTHHMTDGDRGRGPTHTWGFRRASGNRGCEAAQLIGVHPSHAPAAINHRGSPGCTRLCTWLGAKLLLGPMDLLTDGECLQLCLHNTVIKHPLPGPHAGEYPGQGQGQGRVRQAGRGYWLWGSLGH